MLLYPDVQQQAQEEIDRVIGCDRLPSLQDQEDLPYIQAVLLECLRWYPVVPAGRNELTFHSHMPLNSLPQGFHTV